MIREPFDALVCDLDGVLYRGAEQIQGASDAIRSLRDAGIRVLFCSNNSRPTIEQYRDRLSGFGIDATDDDILSSAVVSSEVLARRFEPDDCVFVVGGDGLREAVISAGLRVADESEGVAAVLVGWDPDFDYGAMRSASIAVLSGAALIASNDDAAFPAENALWPGAGAILASIEVASGTRAEVLGKPHEPMLDAIERRLGRNARIAAVGDRPETDLEGATARGWTTILVTSGVTDDATARALEPQPDAVLASIAALPDLLANLQRES